MLIGNDFKRLETSSDLGFFVNQYEMTPKQFKEYYEESDFTEELQNKVVVSVECNYDNSPIRILGMYFPKENQRATLEYYGHISFITINNSDDKLICLLCKDDECMPQTFDEWFDVSNENHCISEDYDYYNREYAIKLINTVIKGASQDLNIRDYSEEDIIILEGL